ncbi:MAG: hypothetical protein PVF50_05610 [Gammaproteobacteria bacterium]
MDRRQLLGASLTLPFASCTSPSSAPPPIPAVPRFGINLSGPLADWNTEQAFANAFRLARPWVSQQPGEGWGQGPALDLDEYGWIRRLEPDCHAETLMCTIDGGHYPSGTYTILYDGEGELDLSFAAQIVSRDTGRIIANVDSSKGHFTLSLRSTNTQNYVRNIRVMMPGLADQPPEEPFRTSFLERWRGVACIRFMDWMATNESDIATWSQRPAPQIATYSARGVDIETMIDLANELDAEPWFCIPHLADDDYVRNFATAIRDRLDERLRVWVEYSNELWNSSFTQHQDVARRGAQLGFRGRDWEIAWQYTGFRSQEIFDIFRSILGTDGRVVAVLASQAASENASRAVLNTRDAYKSADALAIAPYMMCNVMGESGSDELRESRVEKWDLEMAFAYMERTALPGAIESMAKQKQIADEHGLKLVAYEAGQHMSARRGSENNEALTRLFVAANAHPRMGELYRRYYDAWSELGGDLLCAYSSVSGWGKWGSWGLMSHMDDDPSQAPKYTASVEWARKCGQNMRIRKV